MFGLTLSFVLAWLPFVRGLMDGPSYEWGTRLFGVQFNGRGIEGDYWFVVLEVVLGLALLYLGWQRRTPWAQLGLVAWFGMLLAEIVHTLATSPEGLRFEGATLGIDIPAGILAWAIYGSLFVLALWWASRKIEAPKPSWGAVNTTILLIALALFPLQWLLLGSGRGQEAADVIGVLMTMAQWLLISLSFARWQTA